MSGTSRGEWVVRGSGALKRDDHRVTQLSIERTSAPAIVKIIKYVRSPNRDHAAGTTCRGSVHQTCARFVIESDDEKSSMLITNFSNRMHSPRSLEVSASRTRVLRGPILLRCSDNESYESVLDLQVRPYRGWHSQSDRTSRLAGLSGSLVRLGQSSYTYLDTFGAGH